METDSELESFLKSTYAEGVVASRDASFTYSNEAALRKIASYQLPFEGAWIVKIIQAVVAGGSTCPIRVDLRTTSIRIFFLEPGFTLDELTTRFWNAEPAANRSLRYLLSGLWNVGITKGWGFQVAFPRQTRTIIWDGERLGDYHSEQTRDCVCIEVAPRSQRALGWIALAASSGARNAELLLALTQRCYVCPLPLTVDGRRLDSLQKAEHQGWSNTSYPVSLGFADGDWPKLLVPPGTFEPRPKSLDPISSSLRQGGDGWRSVGERRLEKLTARETAGMAYLLSVHRKKVSSGKSSKWVVDKGRSVVYWVLDGALSTVDPLIGIETPCSVGAFLSAEGLETDLSELLLRESPERERRLKLARETLAARLQELPDDAFQELEKRAAVKDRLVGGILLIAGAGLFWSLPWYGLAAGTMGAILYQTAGASQRTDARETISAIRELSRMLKKAAALRP